MTQDEYTDHIISLLTPSIGEIQIKKMFGANAFYSKGTLFGMVMKDCVFHLKANEKNMSPFLENHCTQFNPRGTKKGMPYWSVPQSVIDDADELAKWTKEAIAAFS